MTLTVGSNSAPISIDEVRQALPPGIARLVAIYTGDPDLLSDDDEALRGLYSSVMEQATRMGELSHEHRLFARFIVELDLADEIPSADKMRRVFSVLDRSTDMIIASTLRARQNGHFTQPKTLRETESFSLEGSTALPRIAYLVDAIEDQGVLAIGRGVFFAAGAEFLWNRTVSFKSQADQARTWLSDSHAAAQEWIRTHNYLHIPHHPDHEKDLMIPFSHPTISREIGLFGYISELRIESVDLIFVPQAIGALQQLRSLALSGNQLQTLPNAIGSLQQLQRLDLSFNELQILPRAITGLRNLEGLNLEHNQLRALPNLDDLPCLRELRLAGNPEEILDSPCIAELQKRGCIQSAPPVSLRGHLRNFGRWLYEFFHE